MSSSEPLSPGPDLPETTDRWCPGCASDRVGRIGLEHSINFGPIRAVYSCAECQMHFIFVRPRPPR